MPNRASTAVISQPGWRNWQTQRTQNPPGFGPWGFKSPSRHQHFLILGLLPRSRSCTRNLPQGFRRGIARTPRYLKLIVCLHPELTAFNTLLLLAMPQLYAWPRESPKVYCCELLASVFRKVMKLMVSFAFRALSTEAVYDGLDTVFWYSCETTVVCTSPPFARLTVMPMVSG